MPKGTAKHVHTLSVVSQKKVENPCRCRLYRGVNSAVIDNQDQEVSDKVEQLVIRSNESEMSRNFVVEAAMHEINGFP